MPPNTIGIVPPLGQTTGACSGLGTPAARILLVGHAHFCRSMIRALRTHALGNIVGYAHTIDHAVLAAESLSPDLAVLAEDMSDVAQQLSDHSSVVIIGKDDSGFLSAAIRLASMEPTAALSTQGMR